MHRKLTILFLAVSLLSCKKRNVPDLDFADEMRKFVIDISITAKMTKPDFIIVPQNGAPLVSTDLTTGGFPDTAYLSAIDGHGQEDLFFGYDRDDKATYSADRDEILPFLNICKNNNKPVLVTDYCSRIEFVDESYQKNNEAGFISFAAPDRNLNLIPEYPYPIYGENANDIASLSDAKNFLYLINPTLQYASHGRFIDALKETNYDVLILDLFFEKFQFTASEINQLKTKANGGKRLVLCYMSIGEAEDYRYYWDSDWNKKRNQPDWIYKENKDWRGNYKVFYWAPEWRSIIYQSKDSYLNRILDAGFDGTYLDVIDAFEYFNEIKN